jgi:hypothetical protein
MQGMVLSRCEQRIMSGVERHRPAYPSVGTGYGPNRALN